MRRLTAAYRRSLLSVHSITPRGNGSGAGRPGRLADSGGWAEFGRTGVRRVIEHDLTESEKAELTEAADTVRRGATVVAHGGWSLVAGDKLQCRAQTVGRTERSELDRWLVAAEERHLQPIQRGSTKGDREDQRETHRDGSQQILRSSFPDSLSGTLSNHLLMGPLLINDLSGSSSPVAANPPTTDPTTKRNQACGLCSGTTARWTRMMPDEISPARAPRRSGAAPVAAAAARCRG